MGEDFCQAITAVGPPMDQLSMAEREDMFTANDVDGSGRMDFEEFALWILRTRNSLATFRSTDDDGDGQIDFREWQRMVAALTTEPIARDELDDVFDSLDVDGDGLISFAEFARWMDKKQQPGGLR